MSWSILRWLHQVRWPYKTPFHRDDQASDFGVHLVRILVVDGMEQRYLLARDVER